MIIFLLGFVVFQELHCKVSNHANTKEDNGEDNLREDTDSTGLSNESKEKAHGLPESVVRECGFFIRSKENSIESIYLSLPDSISNTPESCKNIDNTYRGGCWCPGEHGDYHGNIYTSSKDENWKSSNKLDYESKPNRSKGITNTKHNENSANNMNTISTGYKTLEVEQD